MYGLDTIKHKNPTEAKSPPTKKRQVPAPAKAKLPATPGKAGVGKLSPKKLVSKLVESIGFGISKTGRIAGIKHTKRGKTTTTLTAAKKQERIARGENIPKSALEGELHSNLLLMLGTRLGRRGTQPRHIGNKAKP